MTRKLTWAMVVEQSRPLTVDKGHRNMLNTFVEAIINDLPSPCDEMAGFRSTFLAQKAIESIRLKKTLPIQLEDITPCF